MERTIAAAAMAGICLISFGNVVVRYATNISFAFTEEYSVFLLVVMTFVGASVAVVTGGHIRIGVFADRGPRRRRMLGLVALAASVLMFGLIAYYGAWLAWDQYRFEETSAGLGHPTWIYTIWMPVLSIVIIVRVIAQALGGRSAEA